MMKKLLAILSALLVSTPAFADTAAYIDNAGAGPTVYVSSAHPLPVNATVNASVTGFRPTAYGTPLAVSNVSATATLPAGAEVVASNVGTTDAYCALGASATTSNQKITAGGWFGFAISGDTQLSCITASSTTTVNLAGGSGLPTGTAAGSGGGGAVTIASGGVASGAYASGSLAAGAGTDGWNVTEGAKADSAWVSGSGSIVAISKAIANAVTGAIPAGTNLIGKVGIDQTTPGTTNGTQDAATAATGAAVPSKASYVGAATNGATGGWLQGLVQCNQHTYVHVTSATDTLLVQGVASQTVRVCGVKANFTGSAAQSIFVENTASANANCSSTRTQIGPLVTGNASSPFNDGFYNPLWGGLANTSGNGLCVNSSGTGVVDVEVWYAQF